jgi:hypothetical protein
MVNDQMTQIKKMNIVVSMQVCQINVELILFQNFGQNH